MPVRPAPRRLLALARLVGLLALAQGAAAQVIYTCTTPDGRKLTSDRPIADCTSREQRVLNADGSQRGVLPAYLSPEERANKEAEDRRLAAEHVRQQEAVRRDRNLMQRFPNEAAHQAARANALDDANKAMHLSELRIKDLALERRPLDDEAEFYKGKALPGKLKQALDANDASVEAQKQLIENQKAEIVRINKRYDAELARLKKLWAGAAPGSLPPSDAEQQP
ncbi:MAG: DUF4124 domain-containing protein [Pelomonas sp.]|nr:DUF4124 domain-containing protein [Roseateles sp.]